MPRKAYCRRLTDAEVLQLFADGQYWADLNEGVIYSARTGQPVFTHAGSKSPNLWCRLFKSPKYRTLAVAHVIWMLGTQSSIPKGWEVHHWDLDPLNNAFKNLFAMHWIDHQKLHTSVEIPIPF